MGGGDLVVGKCWKGVSVGKFVGFCLLDKKKGEMCGVVVDD